MPRVELFWAPELGNSSFLVLDPEAGAAVAIDPVRDVEQYLERAAALGCAITASLETHTHNDFVSGARELREATGAEIVTAARSGLEFDHRELRHGQSLPVGRFSLRALHTPGHTPQHASYLLGNGRPLALFSGGALMVHSVARTDLFGPHLTVPLAHEAFRTLHQRLRGLPDDVAVYPTHGAGSFCGMAGAGDALSSTMGAERLGNPLYETVEVLPFLARALQDRPYPEYYRRMGDLNRRGAGLAGAVLPRLRSLRAAQAVALRDAGAQLVDLRAPEAFDKGHVRGSYSLPVGDSFAAWAGWILDYERPVVLVGGTRAEQASARRQLFRIGLDGVAGVLAGGVEAWERFEPLASFATLEVLELAARLRAEVAAPLTLVDVRWEDEWAHGHVPGAVHIPLPEVAARAHTLPKAAPVAVQCGAGYRASIAASLLEQAGVERVIRVRGGFEDWERLRLPAVAL